MSKIKTILTACALLLVCGGTVYALNEDPQAATEQVKIKRKCNTCNGTGRVQQKTTHYSCGGAGCAACDYNGYVMEYVTCGSCDGAGWITVR
ncbi:MAG: hypothetical protein NC111_00600 [Bacteroides sp.]|nr:hypothetical protein [Bacteroides sp.]MCM1414151.1 hypothetical protein [Bacteroides sp.]MCM1471017.1 hypothetical protein [Bacteroides sp.]